MAAPEVAGIAALVWAAHPELLSFEVANILTQTATRAPGAGWSPTQGWGVVNAKAAVELATGKRTDDAVVVGEPRFAGRVEGGGSASATADVTYQDGATIAAGAAACTASVGTHKLEATEQKLADGVVHCSWDVRAALGGQRLSARVDVQDAETGAKASRDFQTDVADVTAPHATAARASGRYGARLMLRFRVSEETARRAGSCVSTARRRRSSARAATSATSIRARFARSRGRLRAAARADRSGSACGRGIAPATRATRAAPASRCAERSRAVAGGVALL